jgi:hypothetical protein
MDNHEIALEQQHGNAGASLRAKEERELCFDYSTPVGTHFTVRFEDKAFFGRVLYGHQDCGSAVYDRNGLGNRQKTIPRSASFRHDEAQRLNLK